MEKKNKVLRVNVQLVRVKIYVLLVSLIIDLIGTTFIEYSFSSNLQGSFDILLYISMLGYA